MLLRIKEFFARVYPREDVMEDSRWLLLLAGAFGLQVGLTKSLFVLESGFPFFAGSAVLILFGILPFFWTRAIVLSLGTLGLIADLVIRRYPFSIVLVWVCFFQAFHLWRSQKEIKEVVPQEGGTSEA